VEQGSIPAYEVTAVNFLADALRLEEEIDAAMAAWDLERAEALAAEYRQATAGHSLNGDPARSLRFRAAIVSSRVALTAGRPGQAVDVLSPLLPVTGRLSAGLAGRVHLLLAEAQARLGRDKEARRLLDRVPADELQADPPLRVRASFIRLWLGEVAHLAGELAACAGALEGRRDWANLARLACEEGCAWDRAGDLARARECWGRAEGFSRRLGPTPVLAGVLLHQGRIDHLLGQLASALDRYDEALRCASRGGQALEIELRRLLVRLDLDFHQWDKVRGAADRLLGGLPPGQLPEEVRPLAAFVRGLLGHRPPAGASDEVLAFLAALRGEVDAARGLYAAALAAAPSAERRARLGLALGLLALNSQDFQEARSWLRQAEELSRSLRMPEVLARTLQVCGQMAAEQEGKDELARTLFAEAALITEVQAGQFRDALTRTAYRWQRGSVLRHLLRSACRRGDVPAAFRYQERERGRLLLDLLQSSAGTAPRLPLFDRPDVAGLQREIASREQELRTFQEGRPIPGDEDARRERRRELAREREELLLRRDQHFEDFLRERAVAGDSLVPALPEVADLQRALPAGALYLAPVVTEGEVFLLAVGRGEARIVRGTGTGAALRQQVAGLRECLDDQIGRYRRGFAVGRPERAELDRRLDELGGGPLGSALDKALASGRVRPRRLVWVPDGPLHGVPVHALRRGGRYLVEDYEVVYTFSAALFVHQARTRRHRRGPWRPAVVVTELPSDLPEAAREGEGVAASFLWSRRLPAAGLGRRALRAWLARARAVHFACHAEWDGGRPLAACVRLPSVDTVHAVEWLAEPVRGLPLMALSACGSAEVAPLMGPEVFGLVTGLLGAGVRAVLASLWTVADRETVPLMWRFYRHRLTQDLAAALALAQRETLAGPDSSPLFWAAFALFGDATALPAPGRCWRWLGRWRQRRHARRFPLPVEGRAVPPSE
jgi:tetratricopeptide (TPR) repeat protein